MSRLPNYSEELKSIKIKQAADLLNVSITDIERILATKDLTRIDNYLFIKNRSSRYNKYGFRLIEEYGDYLGDIIARAILFYVEYSADSTVFCYTGDVPDKQDKHDLSNAIASCGLKSVITDFQYDDKNYTILLAVNERLRRESIFLYCEGDLNPVWAYFIHQTKNKFFVFKKDAMVLNKMDMSVADLVLATTYNVPNVAMCSEILYACMSLYQKNGTTVGVQTTRGNTQQNATHIVNTEASNKYYINLIRKKYEISRKPYQGGHHNSPVEHDRCGHFRKSRGRGDFILEDGVYKYVGNKQGNYSYVSATHVKGRLKPDNVVYKV